jgi:hypothetical protein
VSFQDVGYGQPEEPFRSAEEMVLRKGITMWGASATGKTSFLAALDTALIRGESGWRLRGEDPASTQQLIALTSALVEKGVFPRATVGLGQYNWSLVGRLPAREWHWYGPRRRDVDVVIPMPVVDAFGEFADSDQPAGRAESERFVKYLANSAGIVFFYDPIREAEANGVFRHTFGVLKGLDAQLKPHGRLPHHVAVCITKFDEPRMLEAAWRMGIIDYDTDPPYFPRVREQDAREFFERMCAVSRARAARMVRAHLEMYFEPARIRYFVTSAVGFYVDESGVFNPRDFQQTIPAAIRGGDSRVRGEVQPINVVEPIMWLGSQLMRAVS